MIRKERSRLAFELVAFVAVVVGCCCTQVVDSDVIESQTWADWAKRKWFYARIVFDIWWQAIANRIKGRK